MGRFQNLEILKKDKENSRSTYTPSSSLLGHIDQTVVKKGLKILGI